MPLPQEPSEPQEPTVRQLVEDPQEPAAPELPQYFGDLVAGLPTPTALAAYLPSITSPGSPGSEPTFAAGTTNNYALPTGATVYINVNTGAATVTGFVAGADGDRKRIVVLGTETLAVNHDSGSSTAANRIYIPGGATITFADQSFFDLEYHGSVSRWRMINWRI